MAKTLLEQLTWRRNFLIKNNMENTATDIDNAIKEIERLQGDMDNLNRDLAVEHGRGTPEEIMEYEEAFDTAMGLSSVNGSASDE